MEKISRNELKRVLSEALQKGRSAEGVEEKDKRAVIWLGMIPPGQEHKYRYPTEEEVDEMLWKNRRAKNEISRIKSNIPRIG